MKMLILRSRLACVVMGLIVTTTTEVGLRTQTDEAQLQFIQQTQRVKRNKYG
ncbi:hypothetical protein [Chroococcidiopsis sp. CCMEE 29]|uniref:hypothetical protein n=1 Tax=Chroococcidiopsis sp. CCMEE 29 TaxID=155894 RepID=UPI00201FEEE9|nr:hypothetical protein [Chroococcidiopsis sp. CCMEE 29]